MTARRTLKAPQRAALVRWMEAQRLAVVAVGPYAAAQLASEAIGCQVAPSTIRDFWPVVYPGVPLPGARSVKQGDFLIEDELASLRTRLTMIEQRLRVLDGIEGGKKS
jgi:hypothetical protein